MDETIWQETAFIPFCPLLLRRCHHIMEVAEIFVLSVLHITTNFTNFAIDKTQIR